MTGPDSLAPIRSTAAAELTSPLETSACVGANLVGLDQILIAFFPSSLSRRPGEGDEEAAGRDPQTPGKRPFDQTPPLQMSQLMLNDVLS